MNVNDLNEEIMRSSSIHHQALISIGDEGVSITGNNRQPDGRKNAVGVNTKFMTSNGRSRPTTIVQEHIEGDILSVQGPVESDVIHLIPVGIEEHGVEGQLAVGGDLTSLAFKGDESETSNSNVKSDVGDKHGARGVVKPTSIKPP